MAKTRTRTRPKPFAVAEGDPAAATAPVELVDVADLEEAAGAVRLLARELGQYADALVRMPPEHTQRAIEGVNEMLWLGNKQRSFSVKRLALLVCIDRVVAERDQGTGLGRLLVKHFPEVGSDADSGMLADRRSKEYRAFAEDLIRWAYRGNAADFATYRSIATLAVLDRLLARGELLAPGTQPPEPAWCWSPGQAAFAVAACLHVAHPEVGAHALAALGPIASVANHWAPGVRDRWTSIAALCSKVGLVAEAESVRVQWDKHEKHRARESARVALNPLRPLQAPTE